MQSAAFRRCKSLRQISVISTSRWFAIGAMLFALSACGSGTGTDVDPPLLNDATAQVYEIGAPIALSIENTGGGELTSCESDPLPAGLNLQLSSDDSTCVISGTPISTQPADSYIVTATNDTGSDTASVSIAIVIAAPSLADATAQTYETNTPISFSFENTGGEDLTLCESNPSLPIGLAIQVSTDNSTCDLSGTPISEQNAANYTITATNVTGSDSAMVSIEVSALMTDAREWQGIETATIANESNKDIQDPRLVMDETGNGWLTWQQADGTNPNLYSIWVNSFHSDNGWGTAEKIETLDYETEAPTIAMNASGNAMVVWGYNIPTTNGGDVWQLWGSRLDSNNNTWNAQMHIYGGTDNSERSPRQPKIAMDEDGNALLIWNMAQGLSYQGYQLRSSYFDANTATWGAATEIGISPDYSNIPRLAMNADGQAMAIWRDDFTFLQDGFGVTRKVINGRFFNPQTGWGTTKEISFANETTAIDGSITPQLAIDASGNATVVWSHNKRLPDFKSEYNIWARHYNVDTGWDNSVLLETNDSKYGVTPQVAMNDTGKAIAIWVHKPEEQSSALKSIWVNSYDPTGGWAGAQQIETSDIWQNTTLLPQIGLDASGNAMAVWLHRVNAINNVKAIRFDQSSNSWGTLEVIGTPARSIRNPLLASDQMGRVLTVWQEDSSFGLGPYQLKSNLFK